MALAPWYRRRELLCLAIDRAIDLLCREIDRVEVDGGFIYCWAGERRDSLRKTWPSMDSEAAIATDERDMPGHTPPHVEIVLTEVIPRAAPPGHGLAARPRRSSAARSRATWAS